MNPQILALLIVFLLFVIIALAFTFIKMSMDEKKGTTNNKVKTESSQKQKSNIYKEYDAKSVFNFMEFEKIEDNMIIQKNGKRFLMVIECQGINYDLMSEIEKTSVESGFLKFLNTLREPIQIYTQTRTINLESSLQNYRERLSEIETKLSNAEARYKIALQTENVDEKTLNNLRMAVAREKNLYEYGKDVIFNTERMSLNRNVLRKKYYVIVPYYHQDTETEYFDKAEIKDIAFSELYTKSQSIIRTLSGSGVIGQIMDSYELIDMLYNAYNRDEAETYGIEKVIKAGFEELYTTAPDVLDKRMEALDAEIERRALETAKQAVDEAKSEKQKRVEKKEKSLDELAQEMAEIIIEQNKQYLGKEVAKNAIKKVKAKGAKANAKK